MKWEKLKVREVFLLSFIKSIYTRKENGQVEKF